MPLIYTLLTLACPLYLRRLITVHALLVWCHILCQEFSMGQISEFFDGVIIDIIHGTSAVTSALSSPPSSVYFRSNLAPSRTPSRCLSRSHGVRAGIVCGGMRSRDKFPILFRVLYLWCNTLYQDKLLIAAHAANTCCPCFHTSRCLVRHVLRSDWRAQYAALGQQLCTQTARPSPP